MVSIPRKPVRQQASSTKCAMGHASRSAVRTRREVLKGDAEVIQQRLRLGTALRVHRSAGRFHRRETVSDPARAHVRRDAVQRIAPHAGQTEWLCTASGRYLRLGSGHTSVSCTPSPASCRRRSRPSTPVTPPPQVTTSKPAIPSLSRRRRTGTSAQTTDALRVDGFDPSARGTTCTTAHMATRSLLARSSKGSPCERVARPVVAAPEPLARPDLTRKSRGP